MPDNPEELQSVIKQMQQKSPRRRMLDWLRVVAGLSRLATTMGVLILLGVAVSAIWPHAERIKELVWPKPAPAASAPAIMPSPTLLTKTAGGPRLLAITSTPATMPAEPPPAHNIGDIFAVGVWEYCVNGAIRHKSLKMADKAVSPKPGHEFLALRLTICNMGEDIATAPPLWLIGPDDAHYEPTPKAGADASIANESFGTDRHCKRQVVFEVPAGNPYKLVLKGGRMSEIHALVEIGR